MVAQKMHDLTLAAQSLPPLGRGKAPGIISLLIRSLDSRAGWPAVFVGS
jgi:hypothetical protein